MRKWADVPEAERKRLHNAEVRNRSRAREAQLPVHPVSVEGLWMIQRGMCACRECNYGQPLIDGDTVIAHRKHLKSRTTSPGHVAHNVQLWRKVCNDREARQEKKDLAKFDRFEPVKVTIIEKREKKSAGSRWPKGRKLRSKGFERRTGKRAK